VDDSESYLVPADGADAWTVATANRHGSQQLLGVEIVEPTPRLADALQLGPEGRAVVRRRLMLFGDTPVEIANSCYPELLAVGTPLADKAKIRGGAPRAVAALGFRVAYADEEVDLDSTLTPSEAALLKVGDDLRVVRLFRTAYTDADVPVEVTASVMIPAGRTLRHRIAVG
jgi:DNA-binding GntR family transcriptional regulator